MPTVIPHLSSEGWIDNDRVKMTKLYEYFLASQFSQSTTFKGEVASLKYLLNQYKDSETLKAKIITTLTTLYQRYFKAVTVIVEINESEESSKSVLVVDIDAINEDDVTFNLNKSVEYKDNVILNFDILQEEMMS
jgi:hypothetical protein